ncbi:hypothetical protein GUJ93_ZPchr0009g206 [Zizania palustris]|uniref:Uncharacterized protein n=1 Tax=Zizania palustris TaxID=103762 RepID=A0A8J5VLW5_ZIZPA|nr:hypothetical protein GUJ93_ZPchr0009g206 [Zizania palustris]
MSSTNGSKPKDDAPAKDVSVAPTTVTVTKTVEVRESAGQEEEEEAVLKPTKVVHVIPAEQTKSQPKQD